MQVVMIQRLDGSIEYKGTTEEKVDPFAFFLCSHLTRHFVLKVEICISPGK